MSRSPPRPHGLMFHHFHDAGADPRHVPSQGSISAHQFAEMLDFVAETYEILPAREWLRRATTETLAATDLCLTFDDNLRCQFDVALPVLRERGLTAFWFVYTSVLQGNVEPLEIYRLFRTLHFRDVESFYEAFFAAVDRSPSASDVARAMDRFDPKAYLGEFTFYTDADRHFRFVRDEALGPARYHAIMKLMMAEARVDVAELAHHLWMDDGCLHTLHREGHVIGLHSHTHPTRLVQLSEDEQRREYAQNVQHLTTLLGVLPVAMSHPCNSYDARTLTILRSLGIRLGFRSNMVEIADADELQFPREDHSNVLAAMECPSV